MQALPLLVVWLVVQGQAGPPVVQHVLDDTTTTRTMTSTRTRFIIEAHTVTMTRHLETMQTLCRQVATQILYGPCYCAYLSYVKTRHLSQAAVKPIPLVSPPRRRLLGSPQNQRKPLMESGQHKSEISCALPQDRPMYNQLTHTHYFRYYGHNGPRGAQVECWRAPVLEGRALHRPSRTRTHNSRSYGHSRRFCTTRCYSCHRL